MEKTAQRIMQIHCTSFLNYLRHSGTRLRILFFLFENGEVCVSDLAEKLEMTVSAVSHQLKLLKQRKLIWGRREGKQIMYSLADDHVRLIIEKGLEHVLE